LIGHVLAAIEHGSKVGDGFFSFHAEGLSGPQLKRFWKDFGCGGTSPHFRHVATTAILPSTIPAGACRTCAGFGTSSASIQRSWCPIPAAVWVDGAIVKEAFNHDKNAWGGRWLYSLAQHYGFSLEAPFSGTAEAGSKI